MHDVEKWSCLSAPFPFLGKKKTIETGMAQNLNSRRYIWARSLLLRYNDFVYHKQLAQALACGFVSFPMKCGWPCPQALYFCTHSFTVEDTLRRKCGIFFGQQCNVNVLHVDPFQRMSCMTRDGAGAFIFAHGRVHCRGSGAFYVPSVYKRFRVAQKVRKKFPPLVRIRSISSVQGAL